MRMGNGHVFLIVMVVVPMVLCLCSSSADGAPPSSSSSNAAAKVRQTRGFRNSALATARGFGKRTFHQELHPALSAAMADSAAISTNWLAEQMSKNPEIAQLVVERFVDADGDGLVTMEDLMRTV